MAFADQAAAAGYGIQEMAFWRGGPGACRSGPRIGQRAPHRGQGRRAPAEAVISAASAPAAAAILLGMTLVFHQEDG